MSANHFPVLLLEGSGDAQFGAEFLQIGAGLVGQDHSAGGEVVLLVAVFEFAGVEDFVIPGGGWFSLRR